MDPLNVYVASQIKASIGNQQEYTSAPTQLHNKGELQHYYCMKVLVWSQWCIQGFCVSIPKSHTTTIKQTMVTNGKTKALIIPPPRWVSSLLLCV